MMPIVTWGMQSLPKNEAANGTALLTCLRTLSGAMGTSLFMAAMTSATHFIDAKVVANYMGIQFTFGIMTFLALVQLLISVYKVKKL